MEEFEDSKALTWACCRARRQSSTTISRYGTLVAWAQQLGKRDVVQLLTQTINEEKKTDDTLTKLAEAALNQQAA